MLPIIGQIEIVESAEKKVNWGQTFDIALAVIAAVILIAIVFFVVRWLKQRNASAGRPVAVASKEARARIQAALKREEYEAAGDMLVRIGDHADAAEAFIKGKAYLKAARAFLAMGNEVRAIHYFKQAGDIEQAAKLYAERGEFMAAAAEFIQIGRYDLSAKYYREAGDIRRAAESYEKSRDYLHAAKCYDETGLSLKAAEGYAKHFESELEKASGNLSEVGEDREYAKRAGELFKEANETTLASQIFQRAGFFEEAASCLRQTGDFTAAADLLMRASRPLAAAEVLEEAGQERRAFLMRAEAALESGDDETAANMFLRAEEDGKAAALLVRLRRFEEAGALFEKQSKFADAIDAYEKAELFAHAARAAELMQNFAQAAELSRKAGDVDGEIRALVAQEDYFRAGRLQYEHRRYDDSLATLAAIDSRNPIYRRAQELQGDVYRAQSRYEKAYSKYRAALGNRECEPGTLHLFYKMARSLEEENDLTGALDHYRKIISVDPKFEDAEIRSGAMQRRLKRGSLPGAIATSGIFAAPDGVVQPRRYEILEEIARGGMGIVYKARDTVLGRIVAYKILGENLRDNDTAVKYFLREARAAAALSHPNIVTIFDAGEQDGEYYMAMEYVEGTTLKEVIKRRGALPEDQVRFITIHCCRALQYAHSKGIVHRDIKSGNVMITRDKALKIMDFGLAKFMREYQKEHTQQVGTPFYMSPEQIIGKDVDFRSDLYSLGCTVYECATGTVPFFKGDLSYHHVHTAPPPPRGLNPAISPDLERAIMRMLEKKPQNRYQNAQEIIDAAMSQQRAR